MTENTETFGVHLMIDGYGANPSKLANKALLTQTLSQIPALMDMHTICEPAVVEVGPQNKKDPGGISGFVMIAESHISFHTFPNRRFITIDVYTCQNDLNTKKFTELFSSIFEFSDKDVFIQKRGLRYPSSDLTDN